MKYPFVSRQISNWCYSFLEKQKGFMLWDVLETTWNLKNMEVSHSEKLQQTLEFLDFYEEEK